MSTISPRAPHTLKTRRANASTHDAGEPLGRYTDPGGRQHELVRRSGAAGSTLVLDRLARTLTDARLVAHLAADEPLENAQIVASLYLADVHGRRCRRLTAEDLDTAPFATEHTRAASEAKDLMQTGGGELIDERGFVYRLQAARSGTSIPELRWHRHPAHGVAGRAELVSVRQAIGSLESYEPVRTLSARALASHDRDGAVSVAALRAEFHRVHASRIVLNRGLREAVLAAVNEHGLTMSEIAIRCGRIKRDAAGAESGETSWLARRIGTLPEGGKSTPTPWVSSDVLALIAREGLGVAPYEVELG
jgi:hypothetical protein